QAHREPGRRRGVPPRRRRPAPWVRRIDHRAAGRARARGGNSAVGGRGSSRLARRPAARTALAGFATLITRHRERAADSAVDELLLQLIEDIRYEDALRAEGKEGLDRLDNVRELITGAAETVIDEGGELGLTPLDHFLQR